jgi:hypothetical protein
LQQQREASDYRIGLARRYLLTQRLSMHLHPDIARRAAIALLIPLPLAPAFAAATVADPLL